MARVLALACFVPLASGHGAMIWPPSWLDADGSLAKTDHWQKAGCKGQAAGEVEARRGCVEEWYTNFTFIPDEPTIPDNSPLLTYCPREHLLDVNKNDTDRCCMDGCGSPSSCNPVGMYGYCTRSKATCWDCGGTWCPSSGGPEPAPRPKNCAWTRRHPWRAPGSAPVSGPCGTDGGNPTGCPPGHPGGAGCKASGYGHGPDGRSLKGNAQPTEWVQGSVVEAAWGIRANHGGGYQYRLCPRPPSGDNMDLTEKCFQRVPLRFVGDTQWLQNGVSGERAPVQAIRTRNGTWPRGSEWTRIPIPSCQEGTNILTCDQLNFAPPIQGAFGESPSSWRIIDHVQVPSDLVPGDYILSFRWDAEETPQIWNSCSDIRILPAPIHV